MATQDTSSFGMWGSFLEDQPSAGNLDSMDPENLRQQVLAEVQMATSGMPIDPSLLDNLNLQELQQVQSSLPTLAAALQQASNGADVSVAGLPPIAANIVEQVKEANQEAQNFNIFNDPAVFAPLTAGTSLGYAGANGAVANEQQKTEQKKDHPFAFLEDLLAPIMAMFEGIMHYADKNNIEMANGQGEEVSLQNLGNLAPPSTPTIAQSQGLGIG